MALHRLKRGTTVRGFSVSALRSEAKKGRLEIARIANKDYVSDEAIDEMVKRCSEKKVQGSGLKNATDEHQSGTSAMVRRNAALAYLNAQSKKPSSGSLST